MADVYTPLAPIKDFVGQTVVITDLSTYLNSMFKLGIAIAIALAVIMLIYGGLEYVMSGSFGGKSDGKERVQAALLGLVIVLSSFAILNTINPNLLNSKLDVAFVSVEEIAIETPTDEEPVTYDMGGNPIYKGGYVPPINIPNEKSEEALRKYFADNGISINNSPCKEGDTQGCTNVQGLGDKAVSGVLALKNASGANITITGGTEGGHKTHGVGKSIVDLRKNPTLDEYITNNKASVDGLWYTMSDGTKYFDEGDHWHAQF